MGKLFFEVLFHVALVGTGKMAASKAPVAPAPIIQPAAEIPVVVDALVEEVQLEAQPEPQVIAAVE